MMKFNPLTSRLDLVGTSGGGAGTVTSISEGAGIQATPNPIVGAGSIALDIASLTLETTIEAGDLFAFVDVSEGTDPADQRSIDYADVLAAITGDLVGVFQPLDAGLTALAGLTPAGIAVTDGADAWLTRSLAVIDTATVNLTVTNATGVAGNPTIQADVLDAGIGGFGYIKGLILQEDDVTVDATTTTLDFIEPDAILLTSSPAGEVNVDMRKYLLLTGRAGTANNPVLSSTTGGRITGGNLGDLDLLCNALASSSGFINTLSRLRVDTDLLAGNMNTTHSHLELAPSTVAGYTVPDSNVLRGVNYAPVLNLAGDVTQVILFNSAPILQADDAIAHAITQYILLGGTPTFSPDAGTTFNMTTLRNGIFNPTLSATGTANTLASSSGYAVSGTVGSTWTVTDWFYGNMGIPGGTGTITNLGGLTIAALDTFAGTLTNPPFSLRSLGVGVSLRHAGPAVFGGGGTTLPINWVDVYGDLGILPSPGAGRLIFYEPSAGGSSVITFESPALAATTAYVLPNAHPTVTGQSLTSTTGGVMSWLSMQPLDADLTDIAALARVRGDIMVGIAGPAWGRLPIGSADRYLKSDGTDPAWAQVTELGLVDTYNGVATVARGMPSVISETTTTGLTNNVALNEFFNITTTGWYRVSAYLQITTAAGVSSTLPAFNLVWVDGASGVGQSAALTATTATNTTATSRQGDALVYAQAGAFSLGYSTSGYASNAANAMTYTVRIVVEAL